MLANLSTSNSNHHRNGGILDKYSVSSKMVSSDNIYKIFDDDDRNLGDDNLNNNSKKFSIESSISYTPKKHVGQNLTRNFVSFFLQNKKNLNKRSSSCNEKYVFGSNRRDMNVDRSRKLSIREELENLPTEATRTPGSSSFYRVNVSNEQFASALEEMNHSKNQFSTALDELNMFDDDIYGNSHQTSSHQVVNGDTINSDNFDQCSPDACSSSISCQSSKLSIFSDNLNRELINNINGNQLKSKKNPNNGDLDTNDATTSLTSRLLKMSFSSKVKERAKKEKSSDKYSQLNGFSNKDSKSLTDLPRFSTTKNQTARTEKGNSLHFNSMMLIENYSAVGPYPDHPSEQKMTIGRKNPLQRPKSEHLHTIQMVNLRTRHKTGENGGSIGAVGIFGRKDNYETLEKLGEGSYATVYKGRFKIDGSIVALKEIKINTEEGCPFTAIREASLLKGLQHANIVSLHDIIYNKEYLIFVFEYVQKDLGRYLEKYPNGIHPHNAKLYLYQLLRGLAYCHDKKILHRDMKPQNLLISDAGELKIADFGLARAKSVPSHTYSHEVVTLWYRPPDVLLGSTTYSTSLDMWGVGCILAEMIMGNALFPGAKDVFDQLDKIFRIMGTPNESTFKGVEKLPNYLPRFFNQYSARDPLRISPKIDAIQFCGSLLSSFLKMIPATRISASDAMNHAYFCDLPSQIHTLSHRHSIFTVPGITLAPESKPMTMSNFRPAWNNNDR